MEEIETITAEQAGVAYAEEVHDFPPQPKYIPVDSDGYPVDKRYQVIFVDEYDNMYLIGFYSNLRDAEPDLNAYLDGYNGYGDDDEEVDAPLHLGDDDGPGCLGHLEEYASTLSMCFDRIVDTTVGCVQIRGFVFEGIPEGKTDGE